MSAAVFTDAGEGWQGRMAVAAAFGYYDAKLMRYFRETHGLSLADQLPKLRAWMPDLNVPYEGLRMELKWMGKKPSSIEAELSELREFDVLSQQQQQESQPAE